MKFEIFGYVVQDKDSLKALEKGYKDIIKAIGVSANKLKTLILSKNLGLQELNIHIAELEDQLAQKKSDEELEIKWNTRRPHTERYRYPARTLLNKSDLIKIDPRVFFTTADGAIPKIKGDNIDEIAFKCLQWVHRNIKYTSDISQFKHKEEWLFAHETLLLKKGDCEDGAILMANMMIRSGIPYWRVRLNAGSVSGGGHCWVTYLSEKNEWLILDWCYHYKTRGQLWRDAENYFKIWFSFNQKYLFAADMLDR